MLVTYKLHFNVAWPGEVALNVNFIATKECFGFALCGVHCLLHFGGRLHNLHAASAATEGSLNGKWPTVLVAEVLNFFCRSNELGRTGNNGGSAAQGSLAARDLVAHFYNGCGWWPNEGNAKVGNGLSELGILGEKAITRVNAVGATFLDGVQNSLGVEVALGCSLAA